jgi:transcriptional regulator with PAS, ATPase and Fis domain
MWGCYAYLTFLILKRDDFMKYTTNSENSVFELNIVIKEIMPLKDAKRIVEKELITSVMKQVKSTYKAAEILQVSQATIARKSKIYRDENHV